MNIWNQPYGKTRAFSKNVTYIDRSITQAIDLNIFRFNHKHCHMSYFKQLSDGESLTEICCYPDYFAAKDIKL